MFDAFDGILLRGDKNPNTKGLLQVLEKYGVNATWAQLEDGLKSKKIKHLVVAGPENTLVYPDFDQKLQLFATAENLVVLSAAKLPFLETYKGSSKMTVIPLKTYIEKDGTFINFQGRAQKFKKATTVVSEALTLSEAATLMAGQDLKINIPTPREVLVAEHIRTDQVHLETRKKNEFVFNRGRL